MVPALIFRPLGRMASFVHTRWYWVMGGERRRPSLITASRSSSLLMESLNNKKIYFDFRTSLKKKIKLPLQEFFHRQLQHKLALRHAVVLEYQDGLPKSR